MNLPPVGAPTDSRAAVDHVAHHAALAVNIGDTDDAWTDVTLNSQFANYGSDHPVAGYRKALGGLVFLKGLVKAVTAIGNGQIMFTLPVGYRPAKRIILVGDCSYVGGGYRTHAQRIDVGTDGNVALFNPNSTASGQWYSLDGLVFLAEQ